MALIHQDREELIANDKSIEEIREDHWSRFINIFKCRRNGRSNWWNMVKVKHGGHCLACFTGNYPTEIYDYDLEQEEIKEKLVKKL